MPAPKLVPPSPPLHVPLARVRKQGIGDSVGSTGLVRFGDSVDEEWHRELKGRRGVRTFREMRDNDAVIGASIAMINGLLRQVKWSARPADDSPEARAEAEFLDGAMRDMSHTWQDLVTEILSMLVYGWALFEKVFKVRGGSADDPTRRSRFDDGRIGFRKIAIRAQETLDGWEFDEEGGIRGMWQVAAPTFARVLIPIEKAILFRPQIHKNNPEGYSPLRPAWRSWFFAKRMQEIEGIGIERDLVGLPVLELPHAYFDDPTKAQALDNFMTLLQQIRRNEHEGVALPSETGANGQPSGYRLRLMSTGGSRQIDVSGTVERYEKRIAMALQTGLLFLGMDKVGSFSLSSNMTDMLAMSLGAILDTVEETFDRFGVRELYSLNGIPEERWARWVHADIERPDAGAIADSLTKLADSGLLVPDEAVEDYVREQLGLPPRAETDDDLGDLPAAEPPAEVEG